jgi:hypothetical protein
MRTGFVSLSKVSTHRRRRIEAFAAAAAMHEQAVGDQSCERLFAAQHLAAAQKQRTIGAESVSQHGVTDLQLVLRDLGRLRVLPPPAKRAAKPMLDQ